MVGFPTDVVLGWWGLYRCISSMVGFPKDVEPRIVGFPTDVDLGWCGFLPI